MRAICVPSRQSDAFFRLHNVVRIGRFPLRMKVTNNPMTIN
ncbi:hypothetical protein HMPREF0762_00078 [Slackia exigua ATCC 700122]|uniref:Uncharacterized protein n=1 Tax=Slackia exigua (strain ATCC 700122 / DSM 15923 / CIP 105133 / JCM 11022 / KCTC 5966 / S-7) TaxID=649764 RepID=D0WE53_SLAES|nr:hypothetical protein HMPREF0762_00078 [Slackia exigua ATCC 700122]